VRETQHPRTQLSWTRTALALVTVGLLEVRLLLGPDPGAALWVLGAALAAVVLVGVLAAQRLRRNYDALEIERTTTGGRSPAALAAVTVLVSVMGLAAVLTQESLIGL
jgi:uncharacterized membrane protein YidH (DUF202 family)